MQMAEDVQGLAEVEKGIQRVAGGVLHLVLGADARGERGVRFDLGLELSRVVQSCGSSS